MKTKDRILRVTPREFDTILAALRHLFGVRVQVPTSDR
jgi:hypothetical protein